MQRYNFISLFPASKRRANAAAAAAWAERSVMKQRQVAFENPIQVVPAQEIQRRVQSAPNPQHRGLPLGEPNSSDTEESDGDSVTNAESDSAKGASVRKETQQTILDAPSDFEDRDSGFHASEGLSESTAKSETFGSSILSPSSSLLSTSIGTVTCETPRPCTSSTLIEVGSAQREEPIEEDDTLEDDLCTFAFFKDTTERNQDQSSENGKPRQLTAPNRTSECMPRRQHPSHVLTLAGHESAVTQCRVSDTFIATSSRDGTVRIWSVQTGKLLRTLNCKRPVHDFLLVFYRCKWPYLIVCCEDGGILVIKVHEDKATGQIKLTMGGEYTGHLPNPIRSVAMSPSRLDLATGCCFTMNQITRKGRAILVCRGTLKTWDLDTMLKSAEDGVAYEGAPVAVRTMRRLVATGIRRTPGIDGEEVTYGLRALAYSPDGALLVVGFGHPEDAGLWDTHLLVILCAKSMNTLWIEKAHLCQVTRAEFLPTPKGNRIRHGGPHHLILSTFNRMALLSIKQGESIIASSQTRDRIGEIKHFSPPSRVLPKYAFQRRSYMNMK